MGYRADVDGLRAVSIVLVLAFHLGIIGGGFVGVDVFFVISGYLITGLIRSSMDEERFTFKRFYERRARRILPALLTVILVTAAIGYVLLYPGDYTTFGRSALVTLVGVSNVFFLHNTGYFDLPSQSMPLLHTWSLAVEEQFYLFWPALLLAASKVFGRSRWRWCGLLIAIIAASFAAALLEVGRNPKAAFYLPHARVWELSLGGILVFLPQARSRLSEAISPIGLVLILGSSIFLTAQDPFPGLNALAPVVGAAMVIYPDKTLSGRMLGRLAPLGLISYSLYLWHWPIIVFWRLYLNGSPMTPFHMVTIAAVSVGLSILSWKYVEQPFRTARLRSVLVTAVASEFVAAAIIAPIVWSAGFPARIPASVLALGNRDMMWAWQCPQILDIGLLRYPSISPSYPTCIVGAQWATARHHAVVWGDSNAEAILPLLNLAALQRDSAVALVDICPAIIHEGVAQRYWPELPTYNQYCEASRAATMKLLNGPLRIDLVILAASWSATYHYLVRNDHEERNEAKALDVMKEGFDDLLPKIDKGRRVVVFADVPKPTQTDPVGCVLARIALPRRPCDSDSPDISIDMYNRFQLPSHDVLRSVAKQNKVVSYNPKDFLCDARRCRTFVNGQFLYRDAGHFRRNFDPVTVEELVDLMQLTKLFDGLDAYPPSMVSTAQ